MSLQKCFDSIDAMISTTINPLFVGAASMMNDRISQLECWRATTCVVDTLEITDDKVTLGKPMGEARKRLRNIVDRKGRVIICQRWTFIFIHVL
mmetsp:Transcript_111101/g.319237  ORF Transcript_111101/g.319237 Transcript_111101/m.319237 type:complete len:94 (-) Transcript_111101:195-476(-)